MTNGKNAFVTPTYFDGSCYLYAGETAIAGTGV
jgi:hypothetical protein